MKRLKHILNGNLEIILVLTISELLGIAWGIIIFMQADKHNAFYYLFAIIQALIGGVVACVIVAWIIITIIMATETGLERKAQDRQF